MKRKRLGGLRGVTKMVYGQEFGRKPKVQKATTNLSEAVIRRREREQLSRLHSFSADARDILEHTDPALFDHNVPGGEEGYFHSHEPGVESSDEPTEEFTLGDFLPQRRDDRTRSNCIQNIHSEWETQMPGMLAAYLAWQRRGPPCPEAVPPEDQWEIWVISMQSYTNRTFWHDPKSPHVAVTLMLHGFIGATASAPTLAFDLHLLRTFRQLHRVCPHLTIDAFAKALHHIHRIPHTRHLAEQLRSAYDCYLGLLRRLQHRKDEVLHRTEKPAQQSATCPPCFYKTIDDVPLKPAFLAAMDGNNSLKLVDSAIRSGKERVDLRKLSSARWIEPEEVDHFKDEVTRARKEPREPSADSGIQDTMDIDMEMNDGTATPQGDVAWLNLAEMDDVQQSLNTCVDRWKNAGPESRKKMFSLFAYAGIFVCVCRHGHLLLICDMIRSGELMKYPLAIVNRLLDDYGADIGLGYDIMCAFFTTLKHSSISSKVVTMGLSGVVPAFHGHAHNRGCQLNWHPMYQAGCGIEDFETSERTFNLSNHLAMSTRLSTVFHRRQEILAHFSFQDEDKHYNSGVFIYANYKQALQRVHEEGEQLMFLCRQFEPALTASDLEQYLADEGEYLKGLTRLDSSTDHIAEYISLLTQAAELRIKSDKAEERWKELQQSPTKFTSKQASSIKTLRRTTFEKYHRKMDEVVEHEDTNNVETRWQPDSPEWGKGLCLLCEKRYLRAVDELERLLVARMLEMTKLNISGTGYKQREQIAKALKTRSQAIRSALTRYNSAAEQMMPPRPQLNWAEAVEMASSGEFELLRGSGLDARWMDPRVREAINLHYRILRAKEEITRLNVEIIRLLTYMVDEDATYHDAIAETEDPDLAFVLEEERRYHEKVNGTVASALEAASKLRGFTGEIKVSLAETPSLRPNRKYPPPFWAVAIGITSPFPSPEASPAHSVHVDADYDDIEVDPLDTATESIVEWLENLSLN